MFVRGRQWHTRTPGSNERIGWVSSALRLLYPSSSFERGASPFIFGAYKLGDFERSVTPPPPVSGILGYGHLEAYRYGGNVRKGRTSKKRDSSTASVPIFEQESSVETDVSEPVTPMGGVSPTNPISLPTYPGASHYPRSVSPYEALELHDKGSPTDTSNVQMMGNQFGRAGSFLGDGHIVDSRLAIPASGFPTTHATYPTLGPSIQPQEGFLTAPAVPRPSVYHTQDSRRTTARSGSSMSNPHQFPTRRYNPYAGRPPQTARRNQVASQGQVVASAVPTYRVGPHWGAGFDDSGHTASDDISAPVYGEDFAYPPQVATYTPPSVISYSQPTPIETSSWTPPTLDTSAVSQLPVRPMYGAWSPTDEDFQTRQDMMDHAYIGGPSTSRRM